MGIVDVNVVHRALSSPPWSDDQKRAAAELLERLEAGLASALYGTILDPQPYAETVEFTARTGQVLTTFPVFSVVAVNGAPGLPSGYRLFRNRLFVPSGAVVGERLATDTLLGLYRDAEPYRPAPSYGGRVHVDYLAGWGPEPDLVQAIIGKFRTLFNNNHDDTISTVETSGTRRPSPPRTGPTPRPRPWAGSGG